MKIPKYIDEALKKRIWAYLETAKARVQENLEIINAIEKVL